MTGSVWARQLGGILRLELRKSFLSRRGWWIYFLALGPLALSVLHWVLQMGRPSARHSLGEDSMVFAAMFQFYYLRLGIFFGCVGIFSNQFRGEMLEKTLHYYYMTPVRRELLVAGKFIAGWTAATALFVTSVAIAFLALPRHFGPAFTDFVWNGPGLSQLGWYVVTAVLACAGYGAVFVLCGLLFRNPMIPAAVVMVWEGLNPFLPSLLKKISVIYYLKALCPVEVPVPGPFAIMAIVSEPTPAWLAITGMVAVAALVLVYAGMMARRSEISYSE